MKANTLSSEKAHFTLRPLGSLSASFARWIGYRASSPGEAPDSCKVQRTENRFRTGSINDRQYPAGTHVPANPRVIRMLTDLRRLVFPEVLRSERDRLVFGSSGAYALTVDPERFWKSVAGGVRRHTSCPRYDPCGLFETEHQALLLRNGFSPQCEHNQLVRYCPSQTLSLLVPEE